MGPVVVHSDALRMALLPASVAHAVSVWVVHSVADPGALASPRGDGGAGARLVRAGRLLGHRAPAGAPVARHRAEELAAITRRTWPALRALDEATIEEVTRPAINALAARPGGALFERHGVAEMIVLARP
jgi:hypothetical protein